MKTPRYFGVYADMGDHIELTLCPEVCCAEIILGQHKMSNRDVVGISRKAATRHQLTKTLQDRFRASKIRVRTII